MSGLARLGRWPVVLAAAAVLCLSAFVLGGAGAWAVAAAPKAAAPKAASQPQAEAKGPYRQLAPGVVKTVDPARQLDETYSRHDVVELVAVDSKFDWAKEVTFRRDVWYLNFQFKPLRKIQIDLPQPGGKMQRTWVHYLVYSVTNPGKAMHPVPVEEGNPNSP